MQKLGHPIGNYNREFGGIVDGNGKTIRGLKVDEADEMYVGLFAYLKNAVIKNLTVEVEQVNGRVLCRRFGWLCKRYGN